MNEDRLRRIQEALRAEGVDAWFFANFRGSDPIASKVLGLPEGAMVTRRWFYIIPAQGEPIKLNHGIEPHALDALPGRQRLYGKWQEWQSLLKDIFSGCRRIACQYSPMGIVPALGKLDAGTGEFLRGLKLELVSSGDLVARFEVTMNSEQEASHYAAMAVLLDTVDMAFARVRSALQANERLTEYALQQEMVAFMEKGDLFAEAAPIVGVDAHAADPHYEPGPEGSSLIGPDQVLLLDLWGKKRTPGSMYADITWCAWTGKQTPAEQQKVFELVRDARDAGIAKAKEVAKRTVCGWEVDRATRDVIDAGGYGEFFIHRTGHSIFEEDHANGANMDDYETRDTRQLLPHTLFSIEPGIYLPGRFGFRNEINVHVKEGEAVVSGKQQDTLPALMA
jgi:Xaa-Pro dipeptidase